MIKSFLLLIFVLFGLNINAQKIKNREVREKNYELRVADQQKAVLVLFPCFGCDIEHTKREAKFLDSLDRDFISVLFLNFNQKLFLKESEKIEYAGFLNSVFESNGINKNEVHIGGFSSGGNLAILLSSYLLETKNAIQPKGIFAIDSPVDLEKLYHDAEKDLLKNSDPEAVEEAQFLIKFLDDNLGNPKKNINKYKRYSPYLISQNFTENIKYLKDIKTLFYCEPDLDFQGNRKKRKYEDLNAYQLEKLHEALGNLGSNHTEFYMTNGRGIRANGDKNPHSWSLMKARELFLWLLN